MLLIFFLQAKVDATTLDSRGQVIKFDVYQNAVAMALQCVASKLNWSTIWSTSEGRGQMRGGERRGGAEKSIRSLMSLLAWQLATFWDNMQKVNVLHITNKENVAPLPSSPLPPSPACYQPWPTDNTLHPHGHSLTPLSLLPFIGGGSICHRAHC